MKKLILKLVLYTAAVTGLTLGFSMPVNAQQSNKTMINAIALSGLGNFKGNNITVYYGLANKASLSLSESQLTLREVKHKATFRIDADTVELPAIEIPRSGVFMAYNMIIFVIHPSDRFVWVNANRTVPEGEPTNGSTEYLRIDALDKSEFDVMRLNQGAQAKISYTFGSSSQGSIIILR